MVRNYRNWMSWESFEKLLNAKYPDEEIAGTRLTSQKVVDVKIYGKRRRYAGDCYNAAQKLGLVV